jgi:hypothetical protein
MRKILMLFFLVGFAATAQAQFGVRAGFSSANFSETDFKTRSGFHAGVYYTLDLGLISVEPGVQYSQKGYKGTEAVTMLAVDEQLGYFDVPVLVRVDVLPVVNVFAGPQASLLASSKYVKGGQTSDSSDATKGYDIGGVVGAQVRLPLGFNVQASYDFGFTSLNYYNYDVKNQVFKISAGYSF